jgi:pyruvate dehydrogenase E1 component alpha subunit
MNKNDQKIDFPLEELKKDYYMMLLIRRFEEQAGQLYGGGFIAGFCHLYIGQEAVVTGIQSKMQKQDTVITSYRDHGHMLACGMDPNGVMAELTGRYSGYSKGKGGSMHMFSKERGFYGGHGIVGAQVSIGTGMAFAHKYKNDNGICVAYFGDGAANQGQVYESFNMAKLWNLPVLYIIEDNHYGMGTSVHRSSSDPSFSKRGEAYGIMTRDVDGMDIFDVKKAASWAIGEARKNQPVLLHIKTYRYRGHSMSDPAKYRMKEEVEYMKNNRDPIEQLKTFLTKSSVSELEIEQMESQVKKIIKEAAEFAKEAQEPDSDELFKDVMIKN